MQDNLMVVSDLQRALITEIGTILKDLITTVNDDERTGFNGYEQFLPKAIENDDDLDNYYDEADHYDIDLDAHEADFAE